MSTNDARRSQFIVSSITEPISESWSHTRPLLTSFIYKWTIDNFSFYCNENSGTDSFVESIKFKAPVDVHCNYNTALEFFLKLYPRGENVQNSDNLALYLHLITNYSPKVHFKASVLDCNGEKHFSKDIQNDMTRNSRIGWSQFLTRDSLLKEENECVKDDNVIIYCEIEILNQPKTTLGRIVKNELSQVQLIKDLNTSLATLKLSDVTLMVSGREFKAHKAILGARSPVFEAMFDNEMLEKQQNRVEITDVEVEVFEELLQFIYTGKAGSVERYAPELLVLADRYQLDSLKSMCEMVLCAKVTSDSIGDLVLIADRHNATQLKAKAIDYMGSNASNVVQKKDNLKNVMQKKPELFYQMIQHSFKKLNI